jgi:RNA polymerase sigma factor for flagellar operon FliA
MYNVKGKKARTMLEQHAPLVKKLAHQLKAKLPSASRWTT